MPDISLAEQRLLNFAHKGFGEFLTQFLVAGLYDEQVIQSCLFTITVLRNERSIQHRVLAIANDLPNVQTSLPYRRDPLALLALLYLMERGQSVNSCAVQYTTDKILELLGWENTPESQIAVEEAVERYFNLVYRLLMDESELKRQQLAFYSHRECIISRFSTTDHVESEEQTGHAANRVEFSRTFIEQLRNRTWLGIDWNNVQSITVIPNSDI
jgi:hypothetical protein